MGDTKRLTRRSALAAGAAAAAAFAQPAIAAQVEHPNDKVRRLAKEIAVALRDPEFLGFQRVTVTPEGVMYDDVEPELDEELPTNDRLFVLATKFVDDAIAIDPTIKTGWIGNDALPPHQGSLFSVSFERYGTRGSANTTTEPTEVADVAS